MLIVRFTDQFRIEKPSIVTIGTFDGVHLGHGQIMSRLKFLKEKTGYQTVVLTFEPHPRTVLFPDQRDLKLLTTTEEKLNLLEQAGVDVTVVYPFSKTFAAMDSDQYLRRILVNSLNVKHLVIGYDHRFGNNRTGNIETLKQFADELGYSIEEISAHDIDQITISSTKIRKALEEGRLSLANEFLGHPYTLEGRVVYGKQLGRTIGYPTANLEVLEPLKLIPGNGVYFVNVTALGANFFGMMNIGTNPTTDKDGLRKIEVHLFDFNGDLYGKRITIQLLNRIRNEQTFASLEELKQAIANDEVIARKWMSPVP